jgi:hemerythrin-like metal-binding protein
MNRLHDQFQAGVGKLQQKKTIEELQKYTVKHFSLEEQYLASIDYPKLEAHKLIHASLLEEFGEHVAAFKKSGELTSKFFSFLKLWLTAHIQGIDMKYGPKA